MKKATGKRAPASPLLRRKEKTRRHDTLLGGDPEHPHGTIRTNPGKEEPIPTPTDFDADFFPIDGPSRRARRKMLAQMCFQINGKKYMRAADPFEAKLFRQQEQRGNSDIEALRALLGKRANWKTSLCFEAMNARFTRDDAANEVGWLLASAVARGDAAEILEFHNAVEAVKEYLASNTPDNLARFIVTLYGIRQENLNGKLPSRADAKKHLEDMGELPDSLKRGNRGSNDGRFFSGPYLSKFPCGRPWATTD